MKILVLALAVMSFTLSSWSSEVSKQSFGKMPDGTAVDLYTLKDGKIEVRIMTFGGIVQTLKVPDRKGNSDDVVLGFDTLDDYVKTGNSPHFGGIIGRYANRIAERHVHPGRQDLLIFRRTMAPTRCTAARSASTRWCGKPSRFRTASN